jgi:MFS family permease
VSLRQLAGLILASALITLDGTSTTIALPAIARDLSVPMSRLQWIANAPLLMLAALLLPSGTLGDRFGRIRVMRAGLACFIAGATACAAAPSDAVLIAAKLAQGAGASLVLPAALAVLRGAHDDAAERAHLFGIWAAWTGVASAAGPLVAGALVDLSSWRMVFVPSAAAGGAAMLLLGSDALTTESERPGPLPGKATVALVLLLGGLAYALMHGASLGLRDPWLAVPMTIAAAGAVVLARDRQRHVLLPRELIASRNCLPANATTFALYFGMFGLSFLVVLYVQQVLGESALRAAIVLLPMSLMLLLAERFALLTRSLGARWLILAGAVAAGAGIGWMGAHPLPAWWHIVLGTGVFGFGLSLAVSAVTNAAVAAVPETCAGAASGLNHAVVRAAGLAAVALLGSIAAPGLSDGVSAEGVRFAMLVCAGVVVCGGVAGGALLRDEEPGGVNSVE